MAPTTSTRIALVARGDGFRRGASIKETAASSRPDDVRLPRWAGYDKQRRPGRPRNFLVEDATFGLELNSRWLKREHVDIPPGCYQSLAIWPADTGASDHVTTVYDNFGSARRFIGAWNADSIVWVRDTTEGGSRLEQFTYQRVSADAYWYAWHVRRTGSVGMTLGASATCLRKG